MNALAAPRETPAAMLDDAEVLAERVAMLYRDAAPTMVGSVLGSALLLWLGVLDEGIDSLVWFMLVNGSTAARYMVARRYAAAADGATNARAWARRFIAGNLAAGCLWGYCGAMLLPAAPERAYFLAGALMLLAVVPLASMAVIRQAYFAFAMPLVAGFAIGRLTGGDSLLAVGGWASFVLAGLLFVLARRVERNFAAAIWMRREAGRLAERLARENGRVIGAQRALEAEAARRQAIEQAGRAQRERLELIIARTPVGCIGCDTGFRITSWNPAAERIFGYPASEAIGRDILDLVVPARDRRDADQWRNYLAGGVAPADNLLAATSREGRRVVCEWFSTALHDAGGRPIEYFSLLVDVTARRAAEVALAAAKQRLDIALRASAVSLWEWNFKPWVWRADERLAAMLGERGALQLDGPAVAARVHPEELRGMRNQLLATLKGEQPDYRGEMRVRAADGSWIWMEAVGRVVARDAAGRALRMAGSITDISAHKRAHAELENARRAAELASLAKSQFLANMSHEIRTPMNGVLGMLELLRASALDAVQRRYAETADGSARSLLGIINDILDFSKIEAGKLELESIAFDPARAVGEAVALFESPAAAKGLRLVMRIADDMAGAVRGDPLRLRQIVTNLVSNALKFTSAGAITVEVGMLRGAGPEGLSIIVQDTGMGMSEDVQSRLFRPFVQADGSTTRQFGGTGLGLAIVHQLAQLMGGDVQLTSSPGVGSRFVVRLAMPAATTVDAVAAAPRVTAPLVPVRLFAGARVLLAEDNPVNREVALAQLARFGVAAQVAVDGGEALARAFDEDFDLVLMDCQMPVIDGIEVTRRLRAAMVARRVPIVALTANAMAGDRERCMEAGMDDYLAKPFSAAQLGAVLSRWLAGDGTADGAAAAARDDPGARDARAAPDDLPARGIDTTMLDRIREAAPGRGDALVARVVRRFQADAPELIARMRDPTDDAAGLRAVHSLKSSSATLGAARLAALCRRIEAGGRLERGAAVEALALAFAEASAELDELLGVAALE